MMDREIAPDNLLQGLPHRMRAIPKACKAEGPTGSVSLARTRESGSIVPKGLSVKAEGFP